MSIIIILILALGAAWYFIRCGFCRYKPNSVSSTSNRKSVTAMCPTTKNDPVPSSLNDCIAMYKCPSGSSYFQDSQSCLKAVSDCGNNEMYLVYRGYWRYTS